MASVGYATLDIIPSLKGLQGQLDKGTAGPLKSSGAKGGALFGDAAGKSAGSRFGATFKKIVAAAGIWQAGKAALGFLGDGIEEAREAQKIGAQTAAVIKSTGGAAKVTEKDIGKLTGRLSDMAGIDDELIQNGANVLLTFTKIRNAAGKGNNIFDRATKSALNMSTALGTDLKGASVQVGKALNDPIKGATALSRAGVQFTTIQKAQIKALVEGGTANAAVATGLVADTKMFNDLVKAQDGDVSKVVDTLTNKLTPAQKKTFDMYEEGGHTLDAQKRILKELDTQFAGSAKAQATDADKLKVAWGNFKEEVGTQLLPVLDDLATFLRKRGIPAAQDFFGWIKDTGVPAIKGLYDRTKPARKVVKDLVDIFADLPTGGKIATLTGALAGGIVIKHKLSGIFDRGGVGNPMFVTVTNPGFGGAGGGTGGKVATIGKGVAKALPPVLILGGLAYTVDKAILDPARKGATRLEPTRQGFDSTLASIEGVENKAKGFGTVLDLVGSKKVEPKFAVPGLAQGREGLAEFIRLQMEAGKPITPYIQITGFERAMQQIRTLQNAASAVPTAGVDNGATYQHGGTPDITPRAGVVIDQRGSTIVAHDYDDFVGKSQKKARAAGLGGRPQ